MNRSSLKQWSSALLKVWTREFVLVFSDIGVLLFFILLPTIYPLIYTLIYNPEVVHDIPVAVVDNCRSTNSRQFVRMADATEAIHIVGYAASISEAREWKNEKACYGVLLIPHDFDRNLNTHQQATIEFYCDMSLLIRYRAFVSSLTSLSLAYGAQVRHQQYSLPSSTPVNSHAVFTGNPTEGFASFLIPGILILIIQQSLILGISMLGGGRAERRKINGNSDPLTIIAPSSASILGKALCYTVIYIPLVLYMLLFIPAIFNLPRSANIIDIILMSLPLLLSSSFMGLSVQKLSSERESSMLVIVFTSVIFIFLSGLTWPRYAMSPIWYGISSLIPATWGIEAFVNINSMGANLNLTATPYLMLWGLTLAYYTLAIVIETHNKKSAKAINSVNKH